MATAASGTIEFDHLGIGTALSRYRLRVPPNQREYSWEDEQVKELFEDLHRAITQGAYFLGTIVLTRSAGGSFEVADGQQRLATVTILLAAMRDHFIARDDKLYVESIETEHLTVIDRGQRKKLPRLTLNLDDNEYFRRRVLVPPGDKERAIEPARESHRRIDKAAKFAAKHIQDLTRNRSDTGQTETLANWLDFLSNGAQVIVLSVPDHLNAFRMFETLNDRGLKTSQADLLKNYLFGEAGDRIAEAQHKWSLMTGTLESAVSDDITVTYLRHFLVAQHGATREREVYDKIKATVAGPFAAIEVLDSLTENARCYVALLNHRNEHWNGYGQSTTKIRRHVETLNELKVEQIRPLLLACMKSFSHKEAEKAFRMAIRWAVRFIVAGSPTGTVEKYYAGRAAEVWSGAITTASELAKAMGKFVPDDTAFRNAFETLRVPKSYLARYFLRSLEQTIKDDPEPEHVVNDDPTVMTLEHILPEHPGDGWPGLETDVAETAHRRLGNMLLLRGGANSAVGNLSFGEKKRIYKTASTLELTKPVLKAASWGVAEVDARQKEMAKLAVKTWPP